MKHLFAVATLCAAVLLLSGVAVAGPRSAPLHSLGHAGFGGHLSTAEAHADRAPARYVPLARTLTGTGTISLNVYQFDGNPEVGAEADWWVVEDTDWGTGYGYTDANGHVDLTGVPPATSDNGEIAVYLVSADDGMYDLWGMYWDTSWIGGLQPGQLPLTITRSGMAGWNAWSEARVRLYSQKGAETHMARTDITRTGSLTTGSARTITTGPETLNAGTIYFWDDEGMELPVSGTAVSPGATASPSLDLYQEDAQRIWTDFWGSGKPGTVTWLGLENYPNGWTNRIGGVASWPSTAAEKALGSLTSDGSTAPDWKRFTVPSTMAPGYKFYVWAEHTTGVGPLSLVTWFQTCTLKPSKSTVGAGTAIALKGVVPVKGHRGSTPGIRKYVTIYKTTSSKVAGKGQPPRAGGKTVTGWTKVARVSSDRLGRYSKGSIRPSRTTWYVAWYPGDAWYWGAWTSLAKITVR